LFAVQKWKAYSSSSCNIINTITIVNIMESPSFPCNLIDGFVCQRQWVKWKMEKENAKGGKAKEN